MRISDWSSDVCSSDLAGAWDRGTAGVDGALDAVLARPGDHALRLLALLHAAEADLAQQLHAGLGELLEVLLDHALLEHRRAGVHLRSEEHTHELQSLLRKSYAVFCLNSTNTST